MDYLAAIAAIIAFLSAWAILWQLIFGEFEGVWGQHDNLRSLAIAFVASSFVLYLIVD
jgi:hypothetical protein